MQLKGGTVNWNNKNYLVLFVLIFVSSCGGEGSGSGQTDGLLNNEHRIFLTSQSYLGKLEENGQTGLEAADEICKKHAENANLVRDYKAVLSSALVNVKDRLVIRGSIYTVAGSNATKIIENSVDIWDADSTNLLNSIDRDENGSFTPAGEKVWTGTIEAGTVGTGTCNNWTDQTAGSQGTIGNTVNLDGKWLDIVLDQNCNIQARLYCISQ